MAKPELLAPAGGLEQLQYAIRFGADAIYLATDKFGMRQRASNFALDEIAPAVDYAHEHGVKVHVTCNIVMHDDDFATLPHYFEVLADSGVDAFIIGDLGAMRLAKKYAPDVEIHASTQASISNTQSALTWHELGAKRIVCARELSLEQIAKMRSELPSELEIEAFVHGSMCMAYSGRCLISDYMTGRSAQAGHCTQSCRWNYVLEEEKRPGEYYPIEQDGNGSYIMNANDLNMLSHLRELEAAGVDSIKIEGRNKKAFYVATVVNAYRQVLDGADPELFQPELESVSHRPYQTGFYFGTPTQTIESDERQQEYEWAAEVLDCTLGEDGRFVVDVKCRNAFTPSTHLQVLSPHSPIRELAIADLAFVSEHALTRPDAIEPVERANRTMERYRFTCNTELKAHDIIRMRARELRLSIN